MYLCVSNSARLVVFIESCRSSQNNTELFVASIAEPESGTSKAGKKPSTTFEFDRVFGPSSTQVEVFDEIKPMVTSALDGFHACIFAYGQTGAGKSYTMSGPPTDRGVNFRTLQALFAEAADRSSSFEYAFKASGGRHRLALVPCSQCACVCPSRSTCWRSTTKTCWTCCHTQLHH